MGRLVEARPRRVETTARPQRSPATLGTPPTSRALEDYLSRVASYVPSEILAAYLALLPVIEGTTQAGSERN